MFYHLFRHCLVAWLVLFLFHADVFPPHLPLSQTRTTKFLWCSPITQRRQNEEPSKPTAPVATCCTRLRSSCLFLRNLKIRGATASFFLFYYNCTSCLEFHCSPSLVKNRQGTRKKVAVYFRMVARIRIPKNCLNSFRELHSSRRLPKNAAIPPPLFPFAAEAGFARLAFEPPPPRWPLLLARPPAAERFKPSPGPPPPPAALLPPPAPGRTEAAKACCARISFWISGGS